MSSASARRLQAVDTSPDPTMSMDAIPEYSVSTSVIDNTASKGAGRGLKSNRNVCDIWDSVSVSVGSFDVPPSHYNFAAKLWAPSSKGWSPPVIKTDAEYEILQSSLGRRRTAAGRPPPAPSWQNKKGCMEQSIELHSRTDSWDEHYVPVFKDDDLRRVNMMPGGIRKSASCSEFSSIDSHASCTLRASQIWIADTRSKDTVFSGVYEGPDTVFYSDIMSNIT